MHTHKMKLLNNLDQLEAGDVLLFRSVYHINTGQRLISWVQSLFNHKHGHYETVHAGICIGHKNGEPMVAQVTEAEGFMGYFQQPLRESNAGDKESRSLMIFRHRDPLIREIISEDAKNVGKNKSVPKWTFSAAFKTLFARNPSKPDEISQSTICSKFTIEVLQRATKGHDSYPNIPSTSAPKALEASLYKNPHFELLLYTGHPDPQSKVGVSPYLTLLRYIRDERDRIQLKTSDSAAQKKSKAISAILSKYKAKGIPSDDNELGESKKLLQEVMPVLEENTGFGFSTSTSHKNIATVARQMGLFRWQKPVVAKPRAISPYHYGLMLSK